MARRPHSWSGLVLALMLMLGHSAGVQVIAWASMLLDRAGEAPVGEVLRQTFSGDDPCALCHLAAELRQAEDHGDDHAPLTMAKSGKSDCLPVPPLLMARDVVGSTWRPGTTPVPRRPASCPPAPEPPPPRS